MLFNSLEFLIFLPIVFILFWVFPKKYKWIVLLVASYVFYMWWNWKLVFLILFTTIVSYLCGFFIDKYKDKLAVKRAVLISGLVLCFGVLLFFKYFPFLSDVYYDIVGIFTGKTIHGYFDIILPVGISFYTFQTASYVVDVYKGKFPAEKHVGYYALFVIFFPQLVAGPIERPDVLLPQLKAEKHINDIDFSGAFRIMLIGFFKKIAVADMIGIAVNAVYSDINVSTGLSVTIASLLFAVQILCDFSGYTDIAIGCAKLFGVNLTENFNHPYTATSIKDFWNKWHITLSRWLRDYIYFPLGGSRCSKVRWMFNVIVVFFISGLWHGANYTFIVWGLLHGVMQIVGVLTLKYRDKAWTKMKVDPNGKLVTILRIIGTFLLVDFCWIFFRANSIGDAGVAIAKIFSDWQFTGDYFTHSFEMLGFTWQYVLYAGLVIVALPFLEKLKYISVKEFKVFNYSTVRYISYVVVSVCVIVAWIYLQQSNIGSSFIYFQF